MDRHTRACLAYIAIRIASGLNVTSMYDYERSRHLNFDGTVTESSVQIYDYERGCHLGGRLPSLFDYGRKADILLQLEETSFSGYDYGNNEHFNGHISNGTISFYDFSESRYFNYSI